MERSLKKPKNAFRILGIGDSFTYGLGVPIENTYLFQLEEMLNKREGYHQNIEIIKAGIPGFFTEPERIFLEHYGIEYKPNLIIVGFIPHDIVETYFGINHYKISSDGYLIRHTNDKLANFCSFLYIHSHICRIIIRNFLHPFTSTFYAHSKDIYKKDRFLEKSWRKTESEIIKMNKIANYSGAKLVIVLIPDKMPLLEKIDAKYPASRLSDLCKNNGIFFIDIAQVFQQTKEIESFYWKEGHCNSYGHKLIAETIFIKLTEDRLIP